MHPVLFEAGPITVYSYGFLIALGAVLGFTYMAKQGKKRFNMTFDQSNTLFLLLIVSGVVGGKVFMIFEDPSYFFSNPGKLISGNGFVFYGSLLTCIPVMLWYFRKHSIPVPAMLDVMAVVTCIVHGFGRLGCFMAGCCYGVPTDSWLGVIFTDPACQARPLDTSLHPTQLYEATLIFAIALTLLFISGRKKFDGQIFLLYLISYAAGRAVIEIFRGDVERGFVIDGWLSNSQAISALLITVALIVYVKLNRKATFDMPANRRPIP